MDTPGPLIAVMTTYLYESAAPNITQALLQATIDYSQVTIFICTSKRTTEERYQFFMEQLKNKIEYLKLSDSIRLYGYCLNSERENVCRTSDSYNPYIGLIDQADHIIVPPDSQSMTSEPLAAGKTVHIYGGEHEYKPLKKEGLAETFNSSARFSTLRTRRIAPVNITDKVADCIIRKYEKSTKHGFWKHPIRWLKNL